MEGKDRKEFLPNVLIQDTPLGGHKKSYQTGQLESRESIFAVYMTRLL